MHTSRTWSYRAAISAALAAGLTVAFSGPLPARQTTASQSPGPRLVVLVVVDQFRTDYVDLYGSHWTKGLRRLLDGGAVFPQAAYPYAATLTCAGHATIGTGAFPAVHGMSGNTFYDRALRRTVECDFDPDVTSVPFGGGVGRERHGPRSLLVPTFADELRRQARVPAKVVALGLKPRTAIAFAGRGGPDTVALWEEDDGTWATSDAFTKTPWPDVDEFVRAHAIANDYGHIWTLLLPPAAYRFVDDAVGEAVPAPWGRTFPHPLISTTGKADNQFVTAWERSPRSDAFITDLAIHLLGTRRLGTGAGTDFLAISFPSLDLSGHEYGPRSYEVQDTLARVDVNLGRLLDAIEAQVGRDYVIGLTSDHGVSLVPEQVVAEGGDAGRISTTEVRTAVNAAVQRVLGAPGPHVAAIYEEQIALNPGTIELVRRTPGGLQAVTAAIGAVRGVAAAYAADDLVGAAPAADPGIRAWRLSYVPGRSGDFAFTPKPNWIVRATSGTTHGSLNDDDRHVPLILSGLTIRPGRYLVAATPADVVCTFAALVGIQLPRAQGRALTEALAR